MAELDLDVDIPSCPDCGAAMRPDIVWFGEIPYYMYEIESALKDCSVLMVIGTSGAVYPAAGFVMTAKYMGARTICVNLDKPDNMIFVDEFHKGKAGEILPGLVEPLLKSLA
jgi:NAD-dependent deacetylase